MESKLTDATQPAAPVESKIKIEIVKAGLGVPFDKQSIMVTAPTKMGKSTLFANERANALYFDVDKTLSHLPVNKIDVPEWDVFNTPEYRKLAIEAIRDFKPRFIVLDTGTRLYKECEASNCVRYNVSDPSELKGNNDVNLWSVCSSDFQRGINWMFRFSGGLVFLCHAEIKNRKEETVTNVPGKDGKMIPKKTVTTTEKLIPAFRPAIATMLNAQFENQFHIGFEITEGDTLSEQRVIYTRHTRLYEGGTRFQPDELPNEIPLPFDKPLDSFIALEAAWMKANEIFLAKGKKNAK